MLGPAVLALAMLVLLRVHAWMGVTDGMLMITGDVVVNGIVLGQALANMNGVSLLLLSLTKNFPNTSCKYIHHGMSARDR